MGWQLHNLDFIISTTNNIIHIWISGSFTKQCFQTQLHGNKSLESIRFTLRWKPLSWVWNRTPYSLIKPYDEGSSINKEYFSLWFLLRPSYCCSFGNAAGKGSIVGWTNKRAVELESFCSDPLHSDTINRDELHFSNEVSLFTVLFQFQFISLFSTPNSRFDSCLSSLSSFAKIFLGVFDWISTH